MLARWVVAVWVAWLVTLGTAAAFSAAQILNPNPIILLGLLALLLASFVGLVVAATVRLIRGPRRDMALASLLVGTMPLWIVVGHVLLAMRPAFNRHVPPEWPSKVLLTPGRSLADLQARWFYPERTPGKRVTMVGARPRTPAPRWPRWTGTSKPCWPASIGERRGRSSGVGGRSSAWGRCAIYDMAIGSEFGQFERDADGLSNLDRHEVAHCVITRNFTASSDPPRVLIEGWAQANQGTPAEELARTAWNDRENGRSLTLRQLVAPDWYWYSGPAAYNLGAPLVNYILRVYGPERFLKLYTTCQQATFEADCRATLGIGLDELDAACWADTEQIVRRRWPAHAHLAGESQARRQRRPRRLGRFSGRLFLGGGARARPVRSRPAHDGLPRL